MKIEITVEIPPTMVDLSTHELHQQAHDNIVDALIAAGTTTEIKISEVTD